MFSNVCRTRHLGNRSYSRHGELIALVSPCLSFGRSDGGESPGEPVQAARVTVTATASAFSTERGGSRPEGEGSCKHIDNTHNRVLGSNRLVRTYIRFLCGLRRSFAGQDWLMTDKRVPTCLDLCGSRPVHSFSHS